MHAPVPVFGLRSCKGPHKMAAAKIHADNTKRWMNVNESQIKGVVNHLIYNYIIVDPSGPQIYSRSVH